MAGEPYWKLFTGEWMKDECLSFCEPATRGIFVDWLCSMHNGLVDRLTGTARQLGRLGRCNDAEALAALTDLQTTRTAEVSERDGVWTIVSRRRQRELDVGRKRRAAGAIGLANRLANRLQKPDTDTDSDSGKEKEFRKRIGDLFRRRENTAWSEKETAAWEKLTIAEEDLAALERYYAESIPREKDYRRRDLLTLLNNWPGEVDRARGRQPRPKVRREPLPPLPVDSRSDAEIEAAREKVAAEKDRLFRELRGEAKPRMNANGRE